MKQFAQYYALFGHELLLADNGEWIHHAQARSWQPLGYYGTYNQRLQLRDKLKLRVAPKTGVAGDTITIVATNDTGLDAPPAGNVSVSVDGNPASFVSQDGDEYTFTYEIAGTENGGAVGLIDVSGVMDVPFTAGSVYRSTRDVAFVVNHRNELSASITAPAQGSAVSGWVAVDVDAGYALGPEELLAHQPWSSATSVRTARRSSTPTSRRPTRCASTRGASPTASRTSRSSPMARSTGAPSRRSR